MLGRAERPVVATANGTWFVWVVASQSVAVAAATVERVFLYGAAGIFVALRLMLYEVKPADLTAPYWVSMGALSITVLAGARIVEMADAPMVAATRHRIPLEYDAALWSIVFPLGMYAVAGIYLSHADNLPVVSTIGRWELWVAFAAWLVVFVAMLRHLAQSVRRPTQGD
ncbi:SLAC1 family transporter [Kribbella sp. WER1]